MTCRRLPRLCLRWGVVLFGLALVGCARPYYNYPTPDYRAPVIYGDKARTAPRSYIPPTRTAFHRWGNREQAEVLRPRPRTDAIRIERGDTLYRISRKYGVEVTELVHLNGLRPPYDLVPGQTLRLERARTHTVRKGETVYGLARTYDVTTQSLVRANKIVPPYRLSVGQTLTIPVVAVVEEEKVVTATPPAVASVRKLPPPAPAISRPATRRSALPRRSGPGFLWPVRGPVLVGFGVRGNGLRNDGINIAAKKGAPVRAAENGIVTYAGNQLRGFGNLILLKHSGGWTTAYAHNSRLLVRVGDRIKRGQVIARVGKTGNVARSQLHFELRRGDDAVDPTKHLTVRTATKSISRALVRAARRGPG